MGYYWVKLRGLQFSLIPMNMQTTWWMMAQVYIYLLFIKQIYRAAQLSHGDSYVLTAWQTVLCSCSLYQIMFHISIASCWQIPLAIAICPTYTWQVTHCFWCSCSDLLVQAPMASIQNEMFGVIKLKCFKSWFINYVHITYVNLKNIGKSIIFMCVTDECIWTHIMQI